MKNLLVINVSPRIARSVSRHLTRRFVEAWLSRRPNDRIIYRDLASDPPPHVTESWIAAVFTAPDQRTEEMKQALAWSDAAIDELEAADTIVLGTPMYNYGMPSALKSWFDQVIRIGRAYTFDLARGDYPLEPIMAGKRLIVLSSRGEFGFAVGGLREQMNHLDPHIATCAPLIGAARDTIRTVTIEYQEFKDERYRHSRAGAEEQVDALVAELAG